MEYKIKLVSKRVQKEIKKVDNKNQEMIQEIFTLLSKDPRPMIYHYGHLNRNSDVKRVKHKRLRVFYKIDEDKKVIIIGKIENRDSNLYNADPMDWFSA
ncbi:type II toxin-antitoxin system RelE family toxin [Paenibacillus sp. IITD108]|uniref:type II toxin-antitoxin system RelE family toxin n=1 Tax=Paenibacillus sp. IITD108 TaxID=3116649 RepID=UPI002F41C1A2